MRLASRHAIVHRVTIAVVSSLAIVLLTCPGIYGAKSDADVGPSGWPYGQPTYTVPRSYQAHLQQAQELEEDGKDVAAAREYLQCVQLLQEMVSPAQRMRELGGTSITDIRANTLAVACVGLGHRVWKLGQLDLAIELYAGAADIAPGYAPAQGALGRALVEKGQRAREKREAENKNRLEQTIPDDYELGFYRRGLAHLYVARRLQPNNPQIRVDISNGLRLWGLPQEAFAEASKAVDLDGDNAKALLSKGLAAAAIGNPSGAVDYYRSALATSDIEEYPADFRASIHDALGVALSAIGEAEQAVAAHQEAVDLAPANAVYQNNLGAALRADGNPGGSVSAHKEATALDPARIDYHLNEAAAHTEAASRQAAIEAYREAARLDARDPRIHHQLGLALYERGQLVQTIDFFASLEETEISDDGVRGALALIAGHFVSDARINKVKAMDARAYEAIPRLALKPDRWPTLIQSLEDYRELLGSSPMHGDSRLQLQDAIVDYDNLEAVVLPAAQRLSELVRVKTSGVDAIMPAEIPACLLEAAEEDSALAQSVDGLSPQTRRTVVAVAHVLRAGDDLKEAIAELRWARSLDPRNADIAISLGKALLEAGKSSSALASFRRAAVLDESATEAHYYAGVVLAQSGHTKRAMDAWNRALELKMEDPRLYTQLGIAYLQQAEFDRAYAEFNKAIDADADYAPAHYYLGLLQGVRKFSSPITAVVLRNARYDTRIGKAHYKVRGEFIKRDALEGVQRNVLRGAGWEARADEAYDYYNVGVEFALTDPQVADVEGFAVIHAPGCAECFELDWATVDNNVAVCEAMNGNLEAAERLLRRAVDAKPDYVIGHWNLGRVLMQQGKQEEGEAELQQAADLARTQRPPYLYAMEDMLPAPPKAAIEAAEPPEMVAFRCLLEAFRYYEQDCAMFPNP